MKTRGFVGACSALALLVLAAVPAQAKDFSWKLKAGDAFKVSVSQESIQTMQVQGQTIEIPNSVTTDMTWKVESVDDQGNFILGQTIDRMKMKMQAPNNMSVDYDSAREEKPEGFLGQMISGMLSPLVGKTITQKMTPRGEVLETKVPEGAFKGLQNNQFGQMFSEDSIKEMVSKGVPVFPAESIEKGYSWTSDMETKMPIGTMKMANKYTYAGEEMVDGRTLDVFTVDTKLELGGGGQLGAEIKVKDQKNSGKIYFDNQAGRFVKSEMTQNMKLAISVAGQNIDQDVKTTVSMKVEPATGGSNE